MLWLLDTLKYVVGLVLAENRKAEGWENKVFLPIYLIYKGVKMSFPKWT